ncbi:MAG: cytochrome b/b6 domain-containing protein [Rhodobacteraceae bacterium]|jgi:cytochrome b561|nr:cytochrome b/b6 domain-containing protein [Paracoccaceae bacterium]
MKTSQGYTMLQIGLHWLIAAGVVFNYIFSDGMGKALDQRLEGQEVTVAVAPLHVWVGVVLLVLVLVRIALRLVKGAPAQEPGLMGRLAIWMQVALYALILLVPLAGGLTWFGGIEALGEVHAVLANLMVILALGHAAMAIYHAVVLKDGVMSRMIRPV